MLLWNLFEIDFHQWDKLPNMSICLHIVYKYLSAHCWVSLSFITYSCQYSVHSTFFIMLSTKSINSRYSSNIIMYYIQQALLYTQPTHDGCCTTLREESNQTNVILQYKLLAAILRAVCSVIQQS